MKFNGLYVLLKNVAVAVGDRQRERLAAQRDAEDACLEADCGRGIGWRHRDTTLSRLFEDGPGGVFRKLIGARHANAHDVFTQRDDLHAGIAISKIDSVGQRGERCEVVQLNGGGSYGTILSPKR